MNATVRNNDSVDTLEHRIVEQEGAIHTMENRNYFSLYCLQMETQFIHSNLITIVEMLCNLVDIEVQKHREVRLLSSMRAVDVESCNPLSSVTLLQCLDGRANLSNNLFVMCPVISIFYFCMFRYPSPETIVILPRI